MSAALRFLVAMLLFLAAPGAAGAQSQLYRANSGWSSFSYPAGWEVHDNLERTPQRYLENYLLQPRGQWFSGRSGEVAIRILDPMYVAEEARVANPVGSNALFEAFVRARATRASGTRYGPYFGVLNDGPRRYWTAIRRFVFEGVAAEERYYASVNSNGYLNVLAMATVPGEGESFEPTLLSIARTVNYPGPGATRTPAEAITQRWYRHLQAGERSAAMALACSRAQSSSALAGLAQALMGVNPGAVGAAGNAYTSRSDFSGLRFQTIRSSDAVAAVRIGGNIVRPDGSVVPYHENNRFGSNVAVMRYENGRWTYCEDLRGGRG
jgi:hypothetical protein